MRHSDDKYTLDLLAVDVRRGRPLKANKQSVAQRVAKHRAKAKQLNVTCNEKTDSQMGVKAGEMMNRFTKADLYEMRVAMLKQKESLQILLINARDREAEVDLQNRIESCEFVVSEIAQELN